jgi:hypothetical protein
MRRFAFASGLILGGGLTAWLLGSALCYLFTGKLPSIQINQNQRPRLSLIDVDRLYETPSATARVVPAQSWAPDKEAV